MKYPDLIQRPIGQKGGRAMQGRPVERLEEILQASALAGRRARERGTAGGPGVA